MRNLGVMVSRSRSGMQDVCFSLSVSFFSLSFFFSLSLSFFFSLFIHPRHWRGLDPQLRTAGAGRKVLKGAAATGEGGQRPSSGLLWLDVVTAAQGQKWQVDQKLFSGTHVEDKVADPFRLS